MCRLTKIIKYLLGDAKEPGCMKVTSFINILSFQMRLRRWYETVVSK